MRRLALVAYAVLAAACFFYAATLSTHAQTSQQYAPSDGSAATSPGAKPANPLAPDTPGPQTQPPPPPADVDEPDAAGLKERVTNAVAPKPYSQVVDDADRRRFRAPGWKQDRVAGAYRKGVHEAPGGGARDARFKVKIPTAGYYTLYARWPASAGNTSTARVAVSTSSGVRWEVLDQTADDSSWVRIGAFKMAAGDRYAVKLVPGKGGATAADAVMVSKNVLVGKNAQMVSVGGPGAFGNAGGTTSGKASGGAIVNTARGHLGKPYDYDHAPCRRSMAREDCSCLTRNVFLSHGITLSDSPVHQLNAGRGFEFRNKSLMKPGDLVFHDLTQDGDLDDHYTDHVAIYAGNGNIIHASSYFGKVVESKERYLADFYAAKRF